MWDLDHKEGWVLKNWCFWTVVLEKTLDSPLDCKVIQSVHPKGNQSWIFKDWCWSWSSNNLTTWCELLTHLKRPWYWERLKAGGGRGQQRMRWLDGLMDTMDTSLSRLQSWWWTGEPGVLLSMGSQRVRHDWATEQQRSQYPLSTQSSQIHFPDHCLNLFQGKKWPPFDFYSPLHLDVQVDMKVHWQVS